MSFWGRRKLADQLGMQLCAVLLGHRITDRTTELIQRGADRVYLVDAPELVYFQDEPYAAVLIDLVRKHKPAIMLCGATTVGRSLVSRVAVTVKAGLTADCTGLAIDPETKTCYRPVRPLAATSWLQLSRLITGHRWPPCVTRL